MATLIGLVAVVLTAFLALPGQAVAWNIPGHMLGGSITIQILRLIAGVSPGSFAGVIAGVFTFDIDIFSESRAFDIRRGADFYDGVKGVKGQV